MKKKRITAALLALGLSAVTICSQLPVFAAEETAQATDTAVQPQTADPSVVTTNGIDGWPQASDISSTAAIVMETSTNTVLYSKNADQALYPASAVKVMTCLVALENSSLDDQVTMTAAGVSGVTDGGANISSQLDEVFTMEQCLYAIMVASANDIALQVAEHVGGSVDAFVQTMNTRAQELGCTNTVFTNPTGLPDENQHITAHDMALIMEAAMANETFRTIAATTSYTLPATNVSGGERVLTNSFTMINNASDGYYEPCIGGKEGYTEASGSTLVCEAAKNNMKLVCVVLNGASGVTDDEAVALLNYGFDNFSPLTIADTDFNRLSGGTVIAPNGATEDNLTTEDTSSDGQITRQYYFGGTPVGTAILEDTEQQSNDAAVTGQKNMEAAQNYSASHTTTPYYIIGAIGAAFLLFFLFLLVKVIRS
ncbi:D-alanyl-D-alanine carboxypeptidase [Ruminococcus sp. AM22-13]|nr:D-alanyl-D-alanine carboxypeptidase [Ruminococcus sp. AM22-13]